MKPTQETCLAKIGIPISCGIGIIHHLGYCSDQRVNAIDRVINRVPVVGYFCVIGQYVALLDLQK